MANLKKLKGLKFIKMLPDRQARFESAKAEVPSFSDNATALARALHPKCQHLKIAQVIERGEDCKILVVSQFTLCAECKGQNRPSFIHAGAPVEANTLYEKYVELLRTQYGFEVGTGEFGADMKVSLLNDGPVTIILDSDKL
jgi:hypothetical protein